MDGSIFNFMGMGNYSYINTNSLYNLFIATLKSSSEDQQRDLIENIKINLGMSWFDSFKTYALRKLPINHYVVKLLQ
jgi:hypothetical protein